MKIERPQLWAAKAIRLGMAAFSVVLDGALRIQAGSQERRLRELMTRLLAESS